MADAGRDGLKGQRRREGEAVIDENPEPQALEGWMGRLTPSQSHTHTHAFVSARVPRTPSELFDPADTLKMTREAARRHSSP